VGALRLDDSASAVEGVGPRFAKNLATGLSVVTVRDLVEHYPRRYQDLGELADLTDVVIGQPATLVGTVESWERRITQRRGKGGKGGKGGRGGGTRLVISEAVVRTERGQTFAVTFFNQDWRERSLKPGTVAAFSGKVDSFRGAHKLTMPEVQSLGRGVHAAGAADGIEHRRLLPIYPATESVPSWKLSTWIEAALDELPLFVDYLDEVVLDEQDLLALDDAMRGVHLPDDMPTAKAARKRLVFDELFTLQLGLQWRRHRLEADVVGLDNAPIDGGLADRYIDSLPFEPTGAQRRALDALTKDLGKQRPMHRLLQGDVGSGKTVVAIWSMLCAVDGQRQAALMVPTEVLAEQHHRTLTEQLAPLGVNVLDGVRVELLTSSTPTKSRRRILAELLSGDVDIVVGTHALLEEGVRFADLGVVVIDEQHRFGVSQRVQLRDKGHPDVMPDVLVMTATPIPRSLALTLYGDLDVTELDELPPGRKPIVTQLITPTEHARRERLYDFVREQAAAGFQTYVVCPLVDPSDEIAATAATAEFERLRDEVFPDLTVELVHGRMSSADKDAAMSRFRSREAAVLVATTVIEVGVDVPTATVMIIEDADRFGISQLHQLRGRVGRGGDKSYCVLFADPTTDEAVSRLQAIVDTTDGFALADVDLDLRGEGQLFGQRQSGLPDLKLARLQRDRAVIGQTRKLALAIIDDDPDLVGHPDLRREVLRRYQGGLDELDALHTG